MAIIIQEPEAAACTPSGLINVSPCVKCLSEKELMAAIVAIFVLSLGTTVKTALEDSACFTCLSKKQMLEAVVEILGDNLLGENATQEQVLDLLKCLRCASDTQLRAAALYLLCTGFTINT